MQRAARSVHRAAFAATFTSVETTVNRRCSGPPVDSLPVISGTHSPSPALPLCRRERTLPIVLVMSEMGHKRTYLPLFQAFQMSVCTWENSFDHFVGSDL
jgi:hypothetical protein